MRNSKGFTLVEMAVVLVIIGIILGAVIKGQDLITNAQTKQIASGISSWRNSVYTYLDRNGRFPGDAGRNGIIGDTAATEQVTAGTAISEIVTTMNYAPTNPITVGGMSFWVYFGNAQPTIGTRNCMVICKDVACANTFSTDELEVIKSLDAAFDGVADAGLGQFRGATAVTLKGGLTTVGTPTRANDVVTAVAAASFADSTSAGTSTAWATTHKAAVWLFDRTF